MHGIDRRHPAGAGTVYALCGGGRRHLHDRGREIHLGEGVLLDAGRLGIRAADRLLCAVLSHPRRRRLVARPRDRTRTLIERAGASAIRVALLFHRRESSVSIVGKARRELCPTTQASRHFPFCPTRMALRPAPATLCCWSAAWLWDGS